VALVTATSCSSRSAGKTKARNKTHCAPRPHILYKLLFYCLTYLIFPAKKREELKERGTAGSWVPSTCGVENRIVLPNMGRCIGKFIVFLCWGYT